MNDAIFTFETTMEKEDYTKFLYTATFKRSKLIIPIIILNSMLGALLIGFTNGPFNIIAFFLYWSIFIILSIVFIYLQVKFKNKNRIKTGKTCAFGNKNILKFYDDKLTFENPQLNYLDSLRYEHIYCIRESKDYFIFYITYNQASLLRKKDINNINQFKDFIIPKFKGKYKAI